MEKEIIAKKSNFSLITWISGMVLMTIVIIFRYDEPLFRYISFALFGYFFIFFIIHLFQPNILISFAEQKIFIHRRFKTIAIEIGAINSIEMKTKNSRGVKYSFGKLVLHINNGNQISISNINNVVKVREKLCSLIGK